MADPPPKKIGSLRDRIAAFENKGSSPASGPAPVPRPKPAGHVSWKPRPATPPPSTDDSGASATTPEKKLGAGMSAADAKASIGSGGSLRDRMAALQGRAGFGAPTPPAALPPKPASEKPKWKPPPRIVSPPPGEEVERVDEEPVSVAEAATSEEVGSTHKEEEPALAQEEGKVHAEEGGEDEAQKEQDPEDEERQRRAAIAARMARLGGARVGMGPPIFGKKPDVPKKPSVPKVEEPKEEVHADSEKGETPVSPPAEEQNVSSPPVAPADATSPESASQAEYFAQTNTSSASLLSADSGSSQPRSPAMPVPAVPRRAAPPRRKAPKSPSPAPAHVVEDAPEVSESPSAGTPQLTSDDSSKQLQEAVQKSKEDEVSLGLTSVTHPHESISTPSVEEPHEEEPVGITAEAAAPEANDLKEKPAETDAETKPGDLTLSDTPQHEHDTYELGTHVAEPEVSKREEVEVSEQHEEQHEVQTAPVEEEAEEDENERRKRIAERLKQQGGFNMFGAPPPPPPVRRPSEHEPPSRKASIGEPQSPAAFEGREEQVEMSSPKYSPEQARRQSTDSLASSIKSPLSPPLPPASTRPSIPERKDSRVSIDSPSKVDEADEDQVQDDSQTISFDNEHHGIDETSEGDDDVKAMSPASEISPIEPEEYEDAREVYDEPLEQLEHEDLGSVHISPVPPEVAQSELVPPLPKRVSIPPPPRAVPPPPPPAVQEKYDDLEDIPPPPPPKRVSIPPPVRSLPSLPPSIPHDDDDLSDVLSPMSAYSPDQGRDDEHDVAFSSPVPSIVHPPHRSIPPPPPELSEYSEDDHESTTIDDAPHSIEPPHSTVEESSGLAYVDEPEEQESEAEVPINDPEVTLTEEEEEAERRKRIAQRLQQQGAFNPFGAPPPIRKVTEPSVGRDAVGSLPPPPPIRKATKPLIEAEIPMPERKAGLPATETPVAAGVHEVGEDPSPTEQHFHEEDNVEDDRSDYSANEGAEPQQEYELDREEEQEQVPPPVPARRGSLPVPPQQQATVSSPTRSQTQVPPALDLPKHAEHEVLDEAEGDPIDPSFYSPQRSSSTSALLSADALTPPAFNAPEPEQSLEAASTDHPVEDEEQQRRRTIAERMAKLGGIRFGAPMPVTRPPPPPAPTADEPEDHGSSEVSQEPPQEPPAGEEDENEFARRQRIAARLAGMGGMRLGMLPGAPAPPPVPVPKSPSTVPRAEEVEDTPPPLPTSRPPPRSAPPPPIPHQSSEQSDIESDGVQVEAEESEIEEVSHPTIEEEGPPTPVPARPIHRGADQELAPLSPSFRPPIPHGRPPVPPSSSRPMLSPTTLHNDFVMVEVPEAVEEIPPTPPPRTVSLRKGPPARSAPPPPPPPPPPPSAAVEIGSQWENTVDFGGETDLSLSGQWSEDSTQYPANPSHDAHSQQPSAGTSSSLPPPPPEKLTSDDLMSQWGRVGVQVHEIATTLHEKSKRSLVGDGTFVGFVMAVLNEVPNATKPMPPYNSFGYLIYEQVGPSVHIRASEIMPGDIIMLHDAKLKGHKGIQIYHQTVGVNQPVCAIISDYEIKKSKVKVFQANQHVGQESVESVSYRLDDLKSGLVKIFRVLEA